MAEARGSELSQDEVLAALLDPRRRRRDFVPIARPFVQQRRAGGGAGPLARFVSSRRGRALDLWLLAHAVASTPPWDVALPAWVWARALGMVDNSSSRVFISNTWTWLEQQQLVRSQRDKSLRRIYLLDDAATGQPYDHAPETTRFDYFKVSHGYWLDGWSQRLELPGKAVLLIALSLPKSFTLPQELGGTWYGLSRDTIRRGLRELIAHDLLDVRTTFKKAPRSPTGAAEERRYTLKEPFTRAPARQAPAAT